jgi:branched-chain amino acid transport system substrate-binding protein
LLLILTKKEDWEMKKKAILMVSVFFLIACILFFTKGTLAQTNVIKVGVLAPLSGWGAEMGIPMKEGIELYFDEANASGKFGNKKVELIILDDEGSASKGPLVARKLIFMDNCQVILGSTASAVTTGLVAIQDEFKTPFIVPVPQAPSITRPPKHWFFRTTSDNVTDLELLIRYIKKKGYKRPALFYHTTAYGLEFKEIAEPVFKEAGIPIVASETHPLTPVNLVPQALNLKKADPDVLLSWSVGQPTALFAIAMRKQLNWDIPLIGGRGLAFPLLIEQGGDSVEGTVLTDAVQFDKPAAKAFIEKYEKKLGKKAYGGLSFAACGYDAAYLLGHVIEKLVKTGKEINKVTIRDAIESVEKLPSQAAGGEGSYYSFNANRHQGASPDWPILNIVKNGQYVNLKW